MSREPVYRTMIVLGRVLFAGLRLKVRGLRHLPYEGGAVLAITHFSYLDFALTEWAVHRQTRRLTRFLATARSFEHRVVGPLMRAMKHIPVERTDGLPAFRRTLTALKDGEIVGIFPEARVNTSWTVGEIKPGAVRLAAAAGVPLIPVVLWGSHRVITRDRRFRISEAFRAPVSIWIGEPIRATRSMPPEVLRDRLQAMLTELQNDFPLKPPPGRHPWWQPAHLRGSDQ